MSNNVVMLSAAWPTADRQTHIYPYLSKSNTLIGKFLVEHTALFNFSDDRSHKPESAT